LGFTIAIVSDLALPFNILRLGNVLQWRVYSLQAMLLYASNKASADWKSTPSMEK
jgi:hypothetical protein